MGLDPARTDAVKDTMSDVMSDAVHAALPSETERDDGAATDNETLRIPELLAPAGDFDALRAALAMGADAVYLGVGQFNARRNAENFTIDTLQEACDLAHLADRRIYLTLNTAVLPSELAEALDLAKKAYLAGVDALIVQDLGLMGEIARCMPEIELHTSTQMNIHDLGGVQQARELGATRVTLARELSLDELRHLSTTGVDLEIFVHGALCVCYSGQCLMSSLIGARSANRGLCAQPCRLPWNLVDTSTNRSAQTEGNYLLSPADLSTIEILPQIIETQAASLKIEGRMKSAEYVALVTGVYRGALDRAARAVIQGRSAHGDFDYQVTADEKNRLAEAFSRGFTTAYLEGDRSNTMMSYKRPNNRGVQVGRVGSMENGFVGLDLDKTIAQGDVLEYWTSRGRCVAEAQELYRDAREGVPLDCARGGSRIYVRIPKPVSLGDRVFRVRNSELLREAAGTFSGSEFSGNKGLVSVDAHVALTLGKPLEIHFTLAGADSDAKVATGSAQGPLVEKARTKAVDAEDVIEHVGRLGGTPFSVRSWDIMLDEGVGIGFSLLHRVRRQALGNLEEVLLAPSRERVFDQGHAPVVAKAPAQKRALSIAVLVRDSAGAKAAQAAGAQVIYQHVLDLELSDTSKGANRKAPQGVIPVLPSICHDRDAAQVLASVVAGKPVVANNLSNLAYALSYDACAEAGSSLNITNKASLDLVAQMGAARAWLSPELSLGDIKRIAPQSPVPLGIVVYGRQELMVTEHCHLMAKGACDQECGSCVRRRTPHLLEDRKGYKFPVRTDSLGRGHIYNAVPLDLTAVFPEIVSCGISMALIDATLLTTKEIAAEVTRALRARDIAVGGGGSLSKREGVTTGHFFRGVL